MPNISIYLTEEQQHKLDILTKKGLAQDLFTGIDTAPERSRSAIVAILIDEELKKLEAAEMIADAVEIDNEHLGWSEEEEQCQITDMGLSG